ncbi:hypothetical protein OSTOST_05259, partial [Ostertagia ostertagi]
MKVVLQGTQPKCKFQNKCLLVKALHPCRDLIGRRQTSQSDSISPSDSPSSSSSSGAKLSPASEEALCFLYGLRDMDSQIRRGYAARHGHCATGPEQDRFFYNPICDFSDVAPNGELSQSIRGDIAMAVDWAEQVPSFHLLSPTLRRHLLHRFCLMFVTIEHGLFTAQMPAHDNVWFLSDRTCLVRHLEAIPEEIKLHLTPKNHKSSGPTIIHESESVPLANTEELRLLSDVRDKVLMGLHAFYIASGEENPEERLSDLLMLSGGVA